MNIIHVGALVRTSYDTGPYRITEVHGPCTCANYIAQINMSNPPKSEPHFHLTCQWAGAVFPGRKPPKENSYLNGYRADGSNVWGEDMLTYEGESAGVTRDMFGAAL